MREGTRSVIDLTDLQGLVSMPSMHVAMSILFAWALWRVPRLAVPGLAPNLAMMISAISQGGRYLIEVITGAVLAWVTIRLVARMRIEA